MSTYGIDDHYRHANDSDTGELPAIEAGKMIVSIDTNVLLKLYKVSDRARTPYWDVLKALGDRDVLFIPDEVMREFWKNRADAISGWEGRLSEYSGKIDNASNRLAEALNGLEGMVAPQPGAEGDGTEQVARWRATWAEMKDGIKDELDRLKSEIPGRDGQSAGEDEVVQKLRGLFNGRVGPPPSAEKRKDLAKKAKESAQALRSPGATDEKKVNDGNVGDFLVWQQILDCARKEKNPALNTIFVTAERKVDWWRTANPQADKRLLNDVANGQKKPSALTMPVDSLVGASQDLIEDYLEVCPDGMVHVITEETMLTDVAEQLGVRVEESDLAAALAEPSDGETVEVTMRADKKVRRGTFNLESRSLAVPEGTLMRVTEAASLPESYSKLRERLIDEGLVRLDSEEDIYVFEKPYRFTSPSTAAAVLSGSTLNWKAWKTPEGSTLPDFMAEWEAELAGPEETE